MSSIEDEITPELIERYDLHVPRYTSYPTVPNWSKEFKPTGFIDMIDEASHKKEPLSLYIHIPFCIRRCLFCACNVLITRREDKVKKYLLYLKKEIDSISSNLKERNDVIQIHLGGGTPTHLSPSQMADLFHHLWNRFRIEDGGELSIEVHPSVTSREHLDVLYDFGFNRLSMGVQDFDPKVQERLNRHQTFEETNELITYARKLGFESINVDLIYGLPYQSPEGFRNTLEKIEEIRPDRLAMYSYAHFPNIFRHHKHIPLVEIPQGRDKLQLFLNARRFLLDIGYRQIGFDHFALETDGLWKSFKRKTLRRNFMGYTTKRGTDLIGFGYSAISELESGYAQNTKDMLMYETSIDKVGVATAKGHYLSPEDRFRKRIIMDFLCLGEINLENLKKNKEGNKILSSRMEVLEHFESIGFLQKKANGWKATPLGTVFSRVIASIFDAYYDAGKHSFSKSI